MTIYITSSLNIKPIQTSQDEKNTFKHFIKPVLIAGAEKSLIKKFTPVYVRAEKIKSNGIYNNRINYAPQNPADVGFTLSNDDIKFEITQGNFKPIFIEGLEQWLNTINGKAAPKYIQGLVQNHILNAKTGKRSTRRNRGKARASSPNNAPNGKKPDGDTKTITTHQEQAKSKDVKFDFTPRSLAKAPLNVKAAVNAWKQTSEKSQFGTGKILIENPLRATAVNSSDLNAHIPGNVFDKIPNGFIRVKGTYEGKINPLVFKTTLIVISAETLDTALKNLGYFK